MVSQIQNTHAIKVAKGGDQIEAREQHTFSLTLFTTKYIEL